MYNQYTSFLSQLYKLMPFNQPFDHAINHNGVGQKMGADIVPSSHMQHQAVN